ncbi:MAG: BTAD domain-containing putative transcriptional regulator [Anaerolineae bacterium]
MQHRKLVVRTKLTPPRLHKRTLHRPRLIRRFLEALDYRLTIVQAGAGYGKSTALASLTQEPYPLAWYHLAEEDVDPLVFLLHLIHTLRLAIPEISEAPLALLENWDQSDGSFNWTAAIDILVNEMAEHLQTPLFLILDDAHVLADTTDPLRILDRLVGRAPADLHVILSTRYPLRTPSMVTWRARGEILEIGQQELAFTTEEIRTLFRERYGLSLAAEEVQRLAAETEGWAIALQLVWQGVRSGAVATLPKGLRRPPGPVEELFAYLAQEILEQQSPDIREFLLMTAVLREMTPTICDCLRNKHDSEPILRYLLETGLFVVDMGTPHVRYHHLFRDFLLHRLTTETKQRLHRGAATCYLHREDTETALYHLLEAGDLEKAAELLDDFGHQMVRAGRLDTLSGWIGALSPEILQQHPSLLVYLGDVARLQSRFEEALGWYEQAEARSRARDDLPGVGQALRGQARVYLDTVNPSQAEHLLQEALRLSDGQTNREAHARLLELMAENRLNLGDPQEAEQLRIQARELRQEGPGEAELAVRVRLRTGRFEQARRILEERIEREEQEPILRPRAHRETQLLLSLILSFQGEGERAYALAVEGTERGQAFHSPFVTAVGYMRQGHAWLLRDDPRRYEKACRCYREAIRISESLAVPRLKVEALWGLSRAHGFRGALPAARDAADQGLELAKAAGDQWIGALILLSMGAGYALAEQHEEAVDWLHRAGTAFQECTDSYGQAVTRSWQSLIWWQTDDMPRLRRSVEDLLQLARTHRYDFLLFRQTLLGPPDPRSLVPLLVLARDEKLQAAYAENLLVRLGIPDVQLHPGYQLRIQTLGPFRLWRGEEEVDAQEWRREKARQLFQLLITYRQRLLDRDQIQELLWPGLDPETALRDFKVALSTLYRVLEPERKRGAPSAYVVRDGTLYGLRPGADIWLDAEEFERLVARGDSAFETAPETAVDAYREALTIYEGEYLQEYVYEDWCSEERERLLTLYLHTADRVARTLVKQEAWEEAIDVCQSILARDACWEQAYRLMMIAYAQLGNRAQSLRSYQRCVEALREELDITPSAATVDLHDELF